MGMPIAVARCAPDLAQSATTLQRFGRNCFALDVSQMPNGAKKVLVRVFLFQVVHQPVKVDRMFADQRLNALHGIFGRVAIDVSP